MNGLSNKLPRSADQMENEHGIDDVIASFHRCRQADDFIETFYTIFLAKSPEIARKFSMTNFKIQKLMLRESLLEMLMFNLGTPGSQAVVEKLGHRHAKLDITPEMYQMWLDSLCEAIEKHDPEYTPELADRWRRAMRRGIDVMLSVE